ncbi:hypothetical protein AMECASPLE_022786 [Ameca splendens]|uniref:Uncharacterized protein n=1 Tax=Ameca splendens TaxID=208324 RepID=A0ABV1AB38_9TELE
MWPELVLGNRRGQFVMSDEQTALIHERLAHLTSEDLNGNPDRDKPPCNSQELEDCDGFPEDSFSLTHFDEESLRPTQVKESGEFKFPQKQLEGSSHSSLCRAEHHETIKESGRLQGAADTGQL